MTRVLRELLGATEPLFSRSLQQMERLSGHPSADIRVTSAITQSVRTKLSQLHLDTADTTGPELYAVLGERLRGDEARFAAATRGVAATSDPVGQTVRLLTRELGSAPVYALKTTAARRLLRANPPKRTMKLLGYRSADSMLRQEAPAVLLAGTSLTESAPWQKRLTASLAKLTPADFESRKLTIEHPQAARWQAVADQAVASHKQFISGQRLCGAVVVLPIPSAASHQPRFPALMTAVLTLHAVNDIRAASAYLRLQHMQSGFGKMVQQVAAGAELQLPSADFDVPVSWSRLHRYLASGHDIAKRAIFEPLVSAETIVWHDVEQLLSVIEPSMEFWQGSAHVGLLHAGQPVSFNLTDALLSHVNKLPFEQRIVDMLQESLRSELLAQYLQHGSLEQTMLTNARLQLAPELAYN